MGTEDLPRTHTDLPHADTRSSRNAHAFLRNPRAIFLERTRGFRVHATLILVREEKIPEHEEKIPELSDRRPSLFLRFPELEISVGNVLCPKHLQNATSRNLAEDRVRPRGNSGVRVRKVGCDRPEEWVGPCGRTGVSRRKVYCERLTNRVRRQT